MPPHLEAKGPVLGTAQTLCLWKNRVEELIFGYQRRLSPTDKEQLLVVGLVQADADWQVQTHAPIFDLAGESTVHGVDEHDSEGEDVHCKQGQEHEGNIAHSEDGMLARDPGEEACRVEEDGVDDDEDDVGNAIAVEILWSKITSAWVHVHHCETER